jgi:hypothetical protein
MNRKSSFARKRLDALSGLLPNLEVIHGQPR